jgi:hypothetical protein
MALTIKLDLKAMGRHLQMQLTATVSPSALDPEEFR